MIKPILRRAIVYESRIELLVKFPNEFWEERSRKFGAIEQPRVWTAERHGEQLHTRPGVRLPHRCRVFFLPRDVLKTYETSKTRVYRITATDVHVGRVVGDKGRVEFMRVLPRRQSSSPRVTVVFDGSQVTPAQKKAWQAKFRKNGKKPKHAKQKR